MIYQEQLAKWEAATLPEYLAKDLVHYTPEQQEDAFYQNLSFGTAGMRGILGAGTNRMNIYTVRQVTEALARYIDDQGNAAKTSGVAISFDSRHFSPEFASDAAQVLSAHGIKAYLFSSLRPTPELSFAVRELGTFAGIMITASHNPKEYNGYKVYGADGGQMVPEAVDAVVSKLENIQDVFNIALDESNAYVQVIDSEIDDKYLANVATVTVNPELVAKEGASLKFVYSPLHGTGQYIGEKALQQAGFTNYTIVKEQAVIDGDFPTVKKPNPEDAAALAMAIDYAKREGADAVVATDPDADRMGAAVKLADGTFQVLTGNQIAAVLVNYLLTAKKETNTLPESGAIVTSIVSSRFASKVAESFGVITEDVLTGFKYIAATIDKYEATKEHTFLFGFEESFGYLVKPFAHDKDAIQALVLFAEVAAYYKSQGKTFADGLEELFEKFGYFEEKTISLDFPGIHGNDEMGAIISQFRDKQPDTIGGLKVIRAQDFSKSIETTVNGKITTLPQPKANVLKYWLEDGSWVAIRPSGTEPKLKFYIGVESDSQVASQSKIDVMTKDLMSYTK
ncbi:phospho-sugar mutase [Leuconostoc gasicomitatum]|uniref:Phosphoglucomutase n=2 Tax=Leuconostoc gasicomitatum TaxID=115778 RepID=A0A9Q3SYG6_9LACO|nr:phospho-sugar mutase [Leuconostoc gasicomitatum]MBZ5963265.1 phospho-sugar mutase [Leuconostoc gasicomitatum]